MPPKIKQKKATPIWASPCDPGLLASFHVVLNTIARISSQYNRCIVHLWGSSLLYPYLWGVFNLARCRINKSSTIARGENDLFALVKVSTSKTVQLFYSCACGEKPHARLHIVDRAASLMRFSAVLVGLLQVSPQYL